MVVVNSKITINMTTLSLLVLKIGAKLHLLTFITPLMVIGIIDAFVLKLLANLKYLELQIKLEQQFYDRYKRRGRSFFM